MLNFFFFQADFWKGYISIRTELGRRHFRVGIRLRSMKREIRWVLGNPISNEQFLSAKLIINFFI